MPGVTVKPKTIKQNVGQFTGWSIYPFLWVVTLKIPRLTPWQVLFWTELKQEDLQRMIAPWAMFLEHLRERSAGRDSWLQDQPGDYVTTHADTFLLRRWIRHAVEDTGWKENLGLQVSCWIVRSLTSSCVCGKSFNFSGPQFLLLQRGCQFIFQVHFMHFHENLGGLTVFWELLFPFLCRVILSVWTSCLLP